MRKGEQTIGFVITAFLLVILAVVIIVAFIIPMQKTGEETPKRFQSCGVAGASVGVQGQCFQYRTCTDEPNVPAEAPGGYWQYLGEFGCPIDEDEGRNTEEYTHCCALIAPGQIFGTGAVLKCAPNDKDYDICHNIPSDDNGKFVTYDKDEAACFECTVQNGECIAREDSTLCQS